MKSFSIYTSLALAALAGRALGAYTLADDYKVDSFSDYFNYFTDTDPTKGFG